jgi:hypothetical protein
VKQADTDGTLRLGEPDTVTGTQILTVRLLGGGARSSSSFSGSSFHEEVHNVLFIDPASGASHWLLPTHRRIMEETEAIRAANDSRRERTPLASVTLVKDSADAAAGDLIVFDPVGSKVVSIATGVRHIDSATAFGESEMMVMFERGGKYVLTHLDAASLTKQREIELRVPDPP